MSSAVPHLPDLQDLRGRVSAMLTRPGVSINELACELHMSRAGLQRLFEAYGTSYTQQLREVRVERAIHEIVAGGRSARATAQLLGISSDHLCRIVKDTLGITPRTLIRARTLEGRIRNWRSRRQPRAGSALYRRRREEWIRADEELQRLLGDFSHDHALAGWAKATLLLAQRPDFRQRDRSRDPDRDPGPWWTGKPAAASSGMTDVPSAASGGP